MADGFPFAGTEANKLKQAWMMFILSVAVASNYHKVKVTKLLGGSFH